MPFFFFFLGMLAQVYIYTSDFLMSLQQECSETFTFANAVAPVAFKSYACVKSLIFGKVQKAIAMLGAEFILTSKRSYVSSYLSFLNSFHSQ